MRKITDLHEFLEQRINRAPDSDCWTWNRSTNKLGYGTFGLNSMPGEQLAHRLAWIVDKGPIPDGLRVCHRCDNPPCCNPAHLFIGTDLDNKRDCMSKGRLRPAAKLTAALATEIYHLAASKSDTDIAGLYGVSKASVCQIRLRRAWKHLNLGAPITSQRHLGENHYRARLTAANVTEMVQRSATETACALAMEFGVHPSTVDSILRGNSWKHLNLIK